MTDELWQSLRYILIAAGGYLAGAGKIAPSDVVPIADSIVQIGGLAVALGSAAWGLYVRFNTRSVPAAVAARPDVPTVSTATGQVQ
jgi:hypothetical protein